MGDTVGWVSRLWKTQWGWGLRMVDTVGMGESCIGDSLGESCIGDTLGESCMGDTVGWGSRVWETQWGSRVWETQWAGGVVYGGHSGDG